MKGFWTCQVTPVTSTDTEHNRSKPCRAASNFGALWLPTTTEMAESAMVREAPNAPVTKERLRIVSEANAPWSRSQHSIAKGKRQTTRLRAYYSWYGNKSWIAKLPKKLWQYFNLFMYIYIYVYIMVYSLINKYVSIYLYLNDSVYINIYICIHLIYSSILLLKRHCSSVEPKESSH